MANKSVVIINSLTVPKIKKSLLCEMKFLVPNYSCLQNPWLGGYRPQDPRSVVLCLQLNFLNPPPEQNSWVRHFYQIAHWKRGSHITHTRMNTRSDARQRNVSRKISFITCLEWAITQKDAFYESRGLRLQHSLDHRLSSTLDRLRKYWY